MSKRFRACSLDQVFCYPLRYKTGCQKDHLARFVADVANELDLSAVYSEYERKDGRGLSAYHPLLMTRLLLYGYCIGITSSRKIEKATYDNLAFRYLSADQHPDHDTLAAFRQEHLEALAGLFVQAIMSESRFGEVGQRRYRWHQEEGQRQHPPIRGLPKDKRTRATLAIRSGTITETSAANRSRRRSTFWRQPTS